MKETHCDLTQLFSLLSFSIYFDIKRSVDSNVAPLSIESLDQNWRKTKREVNFHHIRFIMIVNNQGESRFVFHGFF